LTNFEAGVPAEQQIKTLVYLTNEPNIHAESESSKREREGSSAAFASWLIVLLRGDHQLHETKLSDALGGRAAHGASAAEIHALLGANPGSLGAVGVKKRAAERIPGQTIRIIADTALRGRRNMTTGANTDDYHIRGVDVERDIKVDQWADLRTVGSGEGCLLCDEGKLEIALCVDGRDCSGTGRQSNPHCDGQLWHWCGAHHGVGN
jgi:prolyl-tRNA synthetase